ncbi:hypothetical protein MMC13_001050 [Lambiella insularis]|nr:hypothetical protein [Lambiella insularis]
MSSNGFVETQEGQLFWDLHLPLSASAQGPARPTLLFIHAAVADRTLWDAQAQYFSTRGWSVLRYDLLGFGKSSAKDTYLNRKPRSRVRHYEHTAQIVRHVQQSMSVATINGRPKLVVIGLSRGGGVAIDFAIAYPDLICGLAVVAGGLSGFEYPENPEEAEIFGQEVTLMQSGDTNGLARLNVRIWGDGPLQKEGRVRQEVGEKLYTWCKDIALRECNGTGGSALPGEELDPPAAGRLSEITVPVAVAVGVLDESGTVAAMRYVAEHCEYATIRDFSTAHMVNLEQPDEFNVWLEEWLRHVA